MCVRVFVCLCEQRAALDFLRFGTLRSARQRADSLLDVYYRRRRRCRRRRRHCRLVVAVVVVLVIGSSGDNITLYLVDHLFDFVCACVLAKRRQTYRSL